MNRTTRCKFVCQSVTDLGDAKNVKLIPVTGGSDENKNFWKFTPGGSLEFNYINPKITFVPKQEYYIDITHVGEDSPAESKAESAI